MGFDDLVNCSSFVSAIGQIGYSAEQVSHAIGKLSEAVGSYSHAEGSDRLFVRQFIRPSTVIKMSIVRKSGLPERQTTATLTVDNEKIDWNVLEKNFGPFNKGDIVFHK